MIPLQCECGAKYEAKDSSTGRKIACQLCGQELEVPTSPNPWESEAETEGEEPLLPAPPLCLPKKTKPKPVPKTVATTQPAEKKKKKKSTPAPASINWSQLLTGDIRPLLIAGTCILIGIAAIVFPFVMPAFDPKDLASDPGLLVSRNEQTGAGLILAMHRTFGPWGVKALFVLIGLAFIGGTVWTIKNYDGQWDDD